MKLSVLVLFAVLASACTGEHVRTQSSTFKIDVDEGTTRSITHHADGLARTLSMDGVVVFGPGEILEMDEGVTLAFSQTGGRDDRRGQMVVEDGALVLYVEDGGTLRLGDDDDAAWFGAFLTAVGVEDGPDDDERLLELARDPATPVLDVVAEVSSLSFDSDRVAVLEALLARDVLTTEEQRAIAEAGFALSFGSSQGQVVSGVVRRDDFDPALRSWLLEASKSMTFDSDRTEVLEALLEQDV